MRSPRTAGTTFPRSPGSSKRFPIMVLMALVAVADYQIRDGSVDEIHQDPIPDITYQTQLDQETDEIPDPQAVLGQPDPEESLAVAPLLASDVRYWSDYNRVYYLPRSIHKLPDLEDRGSAEGDWQGGKEAFLWYDSVSSPLESPTWRIIDVFGFLVEEPCAHG